ncbi:helix-turn-helix domain-containing protein [Geomonas anaerohicana]|uniref:Helix-turn-helix transcriptional regulator n=1 Tax=Geomonas anaerohicana TaxID=2798583 RepID=A0ABS0YDK3_9BACT|nr:helix-turn-helix transcriptional regulator [Geomonas anaerohicana]MBJ6750371.1 helix-turn-helix transcriptional regulator [Geomonas anaerohicana]
MLERTKKHPTDQKAEARFIGSQDKISMLRHYAKEIGVLEASEYVTVEEAYPGYAENAQGMALKGARHREGMTQRQLAELTGIPQRHISELESGKRQMGREWARKLAQALNVTDYRVLL